jgi:hypothetical protein
MKPETKARAVVALLVSVLAFIMASGVGAFLGLGNTTTELPDLNLSQPGELPTIWNQPSNTTPTTVQPSNTAQEDVYEEKPSTTTEPTTNQSNTTQNP